MQARMVPISSVFERFPRVVRDLAKATMKEVELVIEGGNTNLDKAIVDEIGEPLMHVLRNCLDHGIEFPQVRAERGKPAAGRLTLRAFHQSNQIVIQVTDDGGGIDFERVRERGVRQGLLVAEGRPTRRELLELIFAPGFSTAETVTSVSGRGVGMDVVRRAIARLSGTIEVETDPTRGTTFTVRLPLTLAIIHALLVRVAGELYAIPLDAVVESVRIRSGDVVCGSGGESILVRDEAIPLIRLSEFFELAMPAPAPPNTHVVIASAAGQHVGFIVDEFVGDQEIVIKPLSDAVGRIPGISGGTVLGNGAIALIIDVNSLTVHALPGLTPAYITILEETRR